MAASSTCPPLLPHHAVGPNADCIGCTLLLVLASITTSAEEEYCSDIESCSSAKRVITGLHAQMGRGPHTHRHCSCAERVITGLPVAGQGHARGRGGTCMQGGPRMCRRWAGIVGSLQTAGAGRALAAGRWVLGCMCTYEAVHTHAGQHLRLACMQATPPLA